MPNYNLIRYSVLLRVVSFIFFIFILIICQTPSGSWFNCRDVYNRHLIVIGMKWFSVGEHPRRQLQFGSWVRSAVGREEVSLRGSLTTFKVKVCFGGRDRGRRSIIIPWVGFVGRWRRPLGSPKVISPEVRVSVWLQCKFASIIHRGWALGPRSLRPRGGPHGQRGGLIP